MTFCGVGWPSIHFSNVLLLPTKVKRHYCKAYIVSDMMIVSLIFVTANHVRALSAVKVMVMVSFGLYALLNVVMSYMETIRITCAWFQTMHNTPIPTWPLNLSDAIVQEMLHLQQQQHHKLERSAHMQSKFLARKNSLSRAFPDATHSRFDVYVGNSGAIEVNGTRWAYLHVWYVSYLKDLRCTLNSVFRLGAILKMLLLLFSFACSGSRVAVP
jgi:hypothetical protein